MDRKTKKGNKSKNNKSKNNKSKNNKSKNNKSKNNKSKNNKSKIIKEIQLNLSSYLKENYKSRISRDIFIYTKINNTYKFLVKQWGNEKHRAKGLYGNAFGTFLCRPPKDMEDLEQQIKHPVNAHPILIPQYNKYLLTYNLNNKVLGFKTDSLKKVLGKNFKNIKSEKIECYKIGSSKENKYSMLSAGMTILATFVKIEKEDYDNLIWIDSKKAYNPKINIHSGIVAHFLKDINEKTNTKILKYFPKLKVNNQKILKSNNIINIYNLINK